MPNQNALPIDPILVKRAYIPADLTYETMSDLGRELFDLSREIEQAGEGLQSEKELEEELTRRKGGYFRNGNE
jgi:hypothetical protein